jgi:hypothetical protein
LKSIILSTLLFFTAFSLSAQSNFYKLSIGAGAGATQSFTEVPGHSFGFAGYGTADYLFTPFISLGIEIQKGEINGGDFRRDQAARQFVNSYKALAITGKIALGQVMDDRYRGAANWIRGLYAGSGIGVIQHNTLHTIKSDDNSDEIIVLGKTSKDLYLPLNLGINFYLPDREGFYRYGLNINYQANITTGEDLDGYNYSKVTYQSGTPDIYTYLSIGLKYNFGMIGLSKKTFRGF